jgi:hypothetical protein
MMGIVQISYSFSQWLDTGCGSVLSSSHGDVDALGTVERALDVVIDFWSTLTKICPFVGVFEEAVFVGTLGAPDNTCRGTGWVEPGMVTVTLMGVTKLLVDFALGFYENIG